MARVKTDLEYFYDYGINLSTRTLYLGSLDTDAEGQDSGVNHSMAERAILGLHLLDMKKDDPITIIMNNPGGDVYHGLAIIDAIGACSNHVTIKVYGMAFSMGAWILQAADERVMAKNSRCLIHYGSTSIEGHSKSATVWAQEEEKINTLMEDAFLTKIKAKHPRFTRKQLHDMLKFDTVFSAQEAVDLGLADKVG